MKYFCPYLILTIITCFALQVKGQNYVDLLKISYDQIQNVPFDNANGEGSFNEVFIDGTVPIPLKKHAIISGFQYESFNLQSFPNQSADRFQSVMIKAGINFNHSKKWSGNYVLLPKLMGQTLTSDDFQIGLISVLSYQKSKHFKYKFGLYLNDELFGTLLVPIFGLYYQKEKWEANLNLPINADINYQLLKNTKAGLAFQGIKKSYNFDQPFNGRSIYLEKSNNEIGFYLQHNLQGIQLRAEAGNSILRTFNVYQKGDFTDLTISAINIGDDRQQLNPSFGNGFYFKLSAYYRLFL